MPMKNTLYILIVVAMTLSACSKPESLPAPGGEVIVNYSVAVPQTRAVPDDAVNYVWYALYDHGTGTLLKEYEPVIVIGGRAECPVSMMRKHSYKVVFVAQHFELNGGQKVPSYSVDAQAAVISMPHLAVANSDNYDVFTCVDEVLDYDGAEPEPVELNRITAQVKFKCTHASWTSFMPTASSLALEGVPQSYNVLTKEFSATAVKVEYAKASLDNGQPCLIGTAYCFARENISKAELTLYNNSRHIVLEADSVPVEKNIRTNVLFTEDLNNL